MRITLKLFATLGKYLPAPTQGNTVDVDVPKDASPKDVMEKFHVPEELVHLVLLNGLYVEPQDRSRPIMREGDALAIWPPVAGG